MSAPKLTPAPALAAREASYSVGQAVLVDGVTLEVNHGELVALVGPNGAGKSTLLSLLTGERVPSAGSTELEGTPLRGWNHKDLARRRAVLTQENHVAFSFRVSEVVEMGRAPWRGTEADSDDEFAIADAMARTDVTHLAERVFSSLSGGEKARASLARVLAQRAPIILLDEPTAALDLRHQEEVLTLARELAREGAAVVVVVHDLSLAGAYADRVAVMDRGQLVIAGAPREVLTAELISRVYGTPVRIVSDPVTGNPVVVPERS
ncbi:heme ABC transporter ATP-binding protein [Demequina sp.]|uniref:heme ABC transporter ATP-binding protein n=1 Tax=Demequina sp. TaxID=2050685 RepID=UPI003D0F636A